MGNVLRYQPEVLKILGCICILLTFFSGSLKFQSIRKKIALILVELGAGVLLISDCFAYYSEGSKTTFGFYAVRISNFLLFLLVACVFFGFNLYLITLYMGRGKLHKIPRRLLCAGFLIGIETVGVLLTPLFGLYYYIDADNVYHRGPLFLYSYLFFFTAFILQLTVIIQYRKMIHIGMFTSILMFACLPFIASFVQWFWYGVSMLNIGIAISAIVLYVFYLLDQNEYLVRAANTEIMTGLPNTHGFMAEAEKKVMNRTITRFNVLYFDIARMGRINRRFGSEIGDVVIKKYAHTIDETLDSDEMLARLGGNYFVAMIKKDHMESFLKLLSDVTVEITVDESPVELHVAAVAGCYDIQDNDVPVEGFIGYPAMALNQAKHVLKKPYAYYTHDMHEKLNESRKLEEEIPRALQRGEFNPCYQPKIHSSTKALCGVEALARWNRANGETIEAPSVFISLMENSDLICEFDFYMLDKVCGDIAVWLEAGLMPPVVSMNFSRRHLGNEHFVEAVLAVLNKHQIKPEFLQIEWKETADEFSLEALRQMVVRLKESGISSAIDDYGSSQSTIRILRDIPFDVIKVDQSCIDYTSEKDIKILKHMIDITKSMGLDMIAECVESREQLDTLTILGCFVIQGFIFSNPLNQAEFQTFMKKGIQ